MIIISSCLTGICCRYDGSSFPTPYTERLAELVEKGRAVAVCPEVLGGLATPRACSELVRGRVLTAEGEDLTDSFSTGAERALEMISPYDRFTAAVLKSRSPSCGSRNIYDGSFSGKVLEGSGVFASLLRQRFPDLLIIDELQIAEYSDLLFR